MNSSFPIHVSAVPGAIIGCGKSALYFWTKTGSAAISPVQRQGVVPPIAVADRLTSAHDLERQQDGTPARNMTPRS
jgi:hypothetical protein